jgi:hypothetical protein
MPTKNKGATENENENFSDRSQEIAVQAMATGTPFVTAGVNRRINLSNFEHLDIYAGVSIPIGMKMEDIAEQVSAGIADAMSIVSVETNNRYQMIKDAQGGGRPEGT